MTETVRRCGGCNGVLEPWQPDVCSDQCGQAVTEPPEDWPDDVFDCRDIAGPVDGFGQVHSDADPGL